MKEGGVHLLLDNANAYLCIWVCNDTEVGEKKGRIITWEL